MLHPFALDTIRRGELTLAGTGRVFPVQLQPEIKKQEEAWQCMAFHFAMWLTMKPDFSNYRLTVDMNVTDAPVTNARWQPIWILFGDLKSKNEFARFLKRYQTWFGDRDMRRHWFPEFPTSGRHALTFMKIPSGLKMDISMMEFQFPQGSVDRWVWVLNNCRRPVYVTPEGLAFTSSKEAVHFKLRWHEAQEHA